jgi:hypothetical protein
VEFAIDHLIVSAPNLEIGAAELKERLGVESVPGGRHTGFGTENRIVPLGDNYLEILAVTDPEEAASSRFGRWAGTTGRLPIGIDAVCLRTGELDVVCERLGIDAMQMRRVRPDGRELSWRVAGLEEALDENVPFFIQWDMTDDLLPGNTPIPPSGVRLDSVTIVGDVPRLQLWTGEVSGLSYRSGIPSIIARFSTRSGPISI